MCILARNIQWNYRYSINELITTKPTSIDTVSIIFPGRFASRVIIKYLNLESNNNRLPQQCEMYKSIIESNCMICKFL